MTKCKAWNFHSQIDIRLLYDTLNANLHAIPQAVKPVINVWAFHIWSGCYRAHINLCFWNLNQLNMLPTQMHCEISITLHFFRQYIYNKAIILERRKGKIFTIPVLFPNCEHIFFFWVCNQWLCNLSPLTHKKVLSLLEFTNEFSKDSM